MLCNAVLVVEDDEAIRDILQFALEARGYRVLTAPDGAVGLEVLRRLNQPCLVLLDLMMPVMDGWAMAEILERDASLSHNPLVLITAATEGLNRIKFKAVIKKPVDMKEFYLTVGRYAKPAIAVWSGQNDCTKSKLF